MKEPSAARRRTPVQTEKNDVLQGGVLVIAQLMENTITSSQGNPHDMDHFVRAWNDAKTIAVQL